MFPSTKNKAFIGAFCRGREAARNGQPPETCPYSDHRTKNGSVTFSRAFKKYWMLGYTEFAADDCSSFEVKPVSESARNPD
ncbi:Rmf/CrpP family protein [Paenibacillus sp. GCM10012303]|uniref:Rmf/CrpP family protein n=1 Tax=Paenibacillus sp. GCM10012303 TaxID=3317340 RepID=UPI00360BE004